MLKPLMTIGCILMLLGCGTENRNNTENRLSSDPANASLSTESNFIHASKGWVIKPIQFFVADNAPDQIIEAAISAASTWNEAIQQELLVFAGTVLIEQPEGLYVPLDDNISVIFFDESWKQNTGKNEYVLATTIWETSASDEDYITKGDIILNAENFDFDDTIAAVSTQSSSFDLVDSESVIVHEMGHLIGLSHVAIDNDPNSVMHPETLIGLGVSNRDLSEADIERANSIYHK